MVALSAVVGCGRLRRCLFVNCCLIANCSRSRSVGGSGGCVVGCGPLRRCIICAPLEGLVVALSAVVGCAAVFLQIAVDLAPLEGLVVPLSAVFGCGAVLL